MFWCMSFLGKTVVVTGASSGIGRSLVLAFAAKGANVVAGARRIEVLEAEFGTMENVLSVGCDVSDEGQCKNLIDKAVERFGGVDVLVNNAGLSMRALFDRVDLGVLRRLMEVNFWGTVYCTKYALSYIEQRRGSLVGVSSVAGYHGLPGRTGYSASKFAMQGFLETVRIENLKKGIHVMVVAPGFTESNVRFSALTADGSAQGVSPRAETKMATSDQVAARIVKGVGRRRRELLMDFDGRATSILRLFAPRLLDWLYYRHMAKEADSPLER